MFGQGEWGQYVVTGHYLEYRVRAAVFHKAEDSDPKIISRLVVSRPRRYSVWEPEEIRAIRPMSEILHTHGSPELDIPVRSVGGTVLFLLIPLDEKLGARLLRFNTAEVPDSIVVADLLQSPTAADDSDGRICLSLFNGLRESGR